MTTYLTPSRNFTLVHVFYGNGEAVTKTNGRVNGAETSLAQNVTDPITAGKRLAVCQRRRRHCRRRH